MAQQTPEQGVEDSSRLTELMLRGALPPSISEVCTSCLSQGAPYARRTVSMWSVSSDLRTAGHIKSVVVIVGRVCGYSASRRLSAGRHACMRGCVHLAEATRKSEWSAAPSALRQLVAMTANQAPTFDSIIGITVPERAGRCLHDMYATNSGPAEGLLIITAVPASCNGPHNPAAHPGVVRMSVFIATVFGTACTRPAASRQQAATSASAALHAMLAGQ